MTRIDVHPPKMLCDQHLLSNHREIKRICNRLRQRIVKNKFDDIPTPFYEHDKDRFKELFWLDKGKWTYNRYLELWEECVVRGFNVTDFSGNWEVYKEKPTFNGNFEPTYVHYNLLENRIMNRMKGMGTVRYYGEEYSFKDFVEKIWKPHKKNLL